MSAWSGGRKSAKRQAAADFNRGGGGRFGSRKDVDRADPLPDLCLDSSDSEVECAHDTAWYGSSGSDEEDSDGDWVPDFWHSTTSEPDYAAQIQRELARQTRFKKYKPGYDKERKQAHRARVAAKKSGSVKMRRLDSFFPAANEDDTSEAGDTGSDTGSDGDSEGVEEPEPALPFVSIMAVIDAKLAAARKRGDVVETRILLAVRQFDVMRASPLNRTELQAAREVARVTWPPKDSLDRVVLVKGESKVWTSARHHRRGAEKIRRVWAVLSGGGEVPVDVPDLAARQRVVVGFLHTASYSTALSRFRTAPCHSFCDWYFFNGAYCR